MDRHSHKVPHHHRLPLYCQRCWVLQGHGVLALMPIYIALVLPSFSAYYAPVQHRHQARSIVTFKAVRKIHPTWPVAVHAALSSNGNSPPGMPFQYSLVTPPQPPSLPPGPTLRGLWPPGTTYYVVATGFLHPLEPQAPLRAGYPANYTSCLAV